MALRHYTLGMLSLVYALNFIDRQILVIMQELIKVDLALSDMQLGLLSGFSFAIFYVTAGIPIARYADRANRRNIVAAALTTWSAMTALSGLAQNYLQLVLARIGVGIGEAGCSPPSHSMISDLYPQEQRATALAVYSSGLYLGVLFGYLLGGWFSEQIGWRNTFLLVGLPGVLLGGVLVLTVREPPRTVTAARPAAPGFWETLRIIWKRPSFPYFSLGCAFSAFVSYGVGGFVPSFLIRYHGLSPSEVGAILALTGGVGGMIGTIAGGVLADRLGPRDLRWYLWVPALAGAIALPLYISTFWLDSVALIVIFYFVASVLGTTYLAPSIAAAHRLVSPEQRAMASAVLLFILNLIGLGLGPVVVGALSDLISSVTGEEGLRLALTIGSLLAIIKVYLFARGGGKFRADIQSGSPV